MRIMKCSALPLRGLGRRKGEEVWSKGEGEGREGKGRRGTGGKEGEKKEGRVGIERG